MIKNNVRFAVILGGVISCFSLLTCCDTYAETYDITAKPITAQFMVGCNTVSSRKGYLTIANRGSLFFEAAALGTKNGCGYYHDGFPAIQQANADRTYGGSRTYVSSVLSSQGNGMEVYGYLVNGLRSNHKDEVVNLNLKTSLYELDVSNNNVSYSTMPAVSSTSYGYSMFISGYFDPNNSWTSFTTPNLRSTVQLAWNINGTSTAFTAAEKTKFIEDVYNHSYSNRGDPKSYLPSSYYESLKSRLGITEDSNWENFVYIISFLPAYDKAYDYSKIEYECGDLCQSSYPDTLDFAQMYGLGTPGLNMSGTDNVARGTKWTGAFISMSPNYIAYSEDLWIDSYQKFFTDYIIPTDAEALSVMSGFANSVSSANSFKTSGWNDINTHNPGTGWWGSIFNLNSIIFPFANFFSGFTSNNSVSIPVLGGMLGLGANVSYSSWWGSDIRNILTPVFNIASLMLLFGFLMSWLRSDTGGLNTDDKILFKRGGK